MPLFIWVFATKYRHRVLGFRRAESMEQIMRDVCANFGAEHVHR